MSKPINSQAGYRRRGYPHLRLKASSTSRMFPLRDILAFRLAHQPQSPTSVDSVTQRETCLMDHQVPRSPSLQRRMRWQLSFVPPHLQSPNNRTAGRTTSSPKSPLSRPLAQTNAAPSTGRTSESAASHISFQLSPWFSVPTAVRWPVQDLSGTSPTIGPVQKNRAGQFQGSPMSVKHEPCQGDCP